MTQAASQALAITQTLNRVMQQDRGRLLAALVARLRDFQMAEDVLQEAAISALVHWGRAGLPHSPQGWLLKVALRRAIDRIRARKRTDHNTAEMAVLAEEEAADMVPDMIRDERLRLIFTCCHPSLDPKSRVALTLRSLCGLSTGDVARVFLDAEPTMGQRLTRARSKILAAGIPYSVPGPEDWAERLNSVLTVVYLVFTTGYAAGPGAGRDLCEEGIYLGRMLNELRPNEAEVEGCLALMLITHARMGARVGSEGVTIPLSMQDRSLWNQTSIDQGLAHLQTAMERRRPGPFQLKAAIAACHVHPAAPDWPQIAVLYGALMHWEPSPIVALNQAVAQMESGDLAAAVQSVGALGDTLANYQPFHAAHAEVLRRNGHTADAIAAYDRAIALADRPEDAAFLRNRRAALQQ